MHTIKGLILLVLAGVLITDSGYCQVPSIVSAPVLEGQQTTQNTIMTAMNTTIASLEKAEKTVEEIKKSADFVRNMKSIQELIRIIETTTCMAKDLEVRMAGLGMLDQRTSCLVSFNYRMNMNRMQHVLDVLNVILTEGFRMNPGERLGLVGDVQGDLEHSQKKLGQVNQELDTRAQNREKKKALREEVNYFFTTRPDYNY